MKSINGLPLDYFAAGVPSGVIFEGSSYQLRKLVSSTNKQEGFLDIISEVSFIGIVSYFEAFFKNHFASIINICPELIHQLKKSGYDVFVDPTDILNAKSEFYRKLGFYISEKYDFGTAQKVNALFVSILNVSPFSKKEKNKYDSILSDRNLLVHHGGIYTLSYAKQKFTEKSVGDKAHWSSLVISKKYYFDIADFLEKIVQKTIKSTKTALIEFIANNKIKLNDSHAQAIEFLDYEQ